MKKNDYIVLSTILILLLFVLFLQQTNSKNNNLSVRLSSDGEIIGEYPISEDAEIELDKNTLVIQNNKARFTNCDCPDHFCEKQSSISEIGQSIICLPNKTAIEIVGNKITDASHERKTISKTDFKLGTVVTITLYDCDDENIIDECMELCNKYENICSSRLESSELYKLNHHLTNKDNSNSIYTANISDDLYNVLLTGKLLSDESDNAFSITLGAITSIWNFTDSNSEYVPSEAEIKSLLPACRPGNIILGDNNTATLKSSGTMIDVGGFAKGYIADRIGELLKEKGIKKATINLGGDTLCIGEDFNIGIQRPYAALGDTVDTVNISNKAVVTSGIYERCFTKNGIIYHHIIDPSTGFPYDNDIVSVTVICDNATNGDYLATYLLSMGSEKALVYAREHNIDVLIIDKNNKILKNIK